jgi:GAF domain-containing protein
VNAKKAQAVTDEDSWRPEEVGLLETLIDQLGVALESARLFEATQQQAERERLISEITSRMRATPDIEIVLQTAVRELRNALNLEEVEVRMGDVSDLQEGIARPEQLAEEQPPEPVEEEK